MQVFFVKVQTCTMHLGKFVYTDLGWLIYHEPPAILSQPSCEKTQLFQRMPDVLRLEPQQLATGL
jgi:hypothetical protein